MEPFAMALEIVEIIDREDPDIDLEEEARRLAQKYPWSFGKPHH